MKNGANYRNHGTGWVVPGRFCCQKGYEVRQVVRHASTDSYSRIAHLHGQVMLHKAELLDEGSLTTLVEQVQPARSITWRR